jgi:hypothetical protein
MLSSNTTDNSSNNNNNNNNWCNHLRNREKNKRGKKSDWHVKLCLMEQNYLSQNQKTYVRGFSPKYFTIWGRNMDTHTTGEQITGN